MLYLCKNTEQQKSASPLKVGVLGGINRESALTPNMYRDIKQPHGEENNYCFHLVIEQKSNSRECLVTDSLAQKG